MSFGVNLDIKKRSDGGSTTQLRPTEPCRSSVTPPMSAPRPLQPHKTAQGNLHHKRPRVAIFQPLRQRPTSGTTRQASSSRHLVDGRRSGARPGPRVALVDGPMEAKSSKDAGFIGMALCPLEARQDAVQCQFCWHSRFALIDGKLQEDAGFIGIALCPLEARQM